MLRRELRLKSAGTQRHKRNLKPKRKAQRLRDTETKRKHKVLVGEVPLFLKNLGKNILILQLSTAKLSIF